MQQVFSPKQVALAVGASESSVKRWCDRGILRSIRTGGGHRRVPLAGVLDFVRAENRVLVRPTELGLPAAVERTQASLELTEEFKQLLATGDNAGCRRIVLSLYLSNRSLAEICDTTLAPAMAALGEGWCNESLDVFEERRGCELALQLVFELRALLVQPPENAPTAMGGTVAGDPYCLPTRMVELALLENGWQTVSLGCGVPLRSLTKAVEEHKPRLFWLSVSALADRQLFAKQYRELFEACGHDTALVVGGRGLDDELRAQMQYSAYCENLQRLETFVRAIRHPEQPDDAVTENFSS